MVTLGYPLSRKCTMKESAELKFCKVNIQEILSISYIIWYPIIIRASFRWIIYVYVLHKYIFLFIRGVTFILLNHPILVFIHILTFLKAISFSQWHLPIITGIFFLLIDAYQCTLQLLIVLLVMKYLVILIDCTCTKT